MIICIRVVLLPAILASALYVPRLAAQSWPPQAYTISAEASMPGLNGDITKATLQIYRDGTRELSDTVMGPVRSRILFDFQAHTFYQIEEGKCSAGRYLSSGPPLDSDPMAGAKAGLAKLTGNRTLKPVRSEPVNGIPARLYEIIGPAQPGEPYTPTRVWVAERGDFAVRLEGRTRKGQPITLFEIKQLSLNRPPASLLTPPAKCQAMNMEMDDTGLMRAHGESTINAQVQAEAQFQNGKVETTGSASVAQITPGTTAKVRAVVIDLNEAPDTSPCGKRLWVRAVITTDGPGTVWYRFYSNVGGVEFEDGQDGTVVATGAETVALTKGATFPISKRGEMRVQAAVQGPTGRHGAVTISNPAPFQVTCAAKDSAAPVAPTAQTPTAVTDVHVEVVPADYSGPCPAKVQLVGTITADGPGTAYYQFQAGAIGANREGTVIFRSAGSQSVTSEGTAGSTPAVQSIRFLAGMEPRGHQENAKWVDADLNLRCGGAGMARGPVEANAAARGNPPATAARRPIELPPGTKVEAEIDDKPLTLKPKEQIAFLLVMSMQRLELEECEHQLHKLCSLEEMASGVAGRKIGLTANPNEDSNYRYTVTIEGTHYNIAAIPRQPGLAGFLYTGIKAFNAGHFYINSAGPASPHDRTLTGYGNQGEDFRKK